MKGMSQIADSSSKIIGNKYLPVIDTKRVYDAIKSTSSMVGNSDYFFVKKGFILNI